MRVNTERLRGVSASTMSALMLTVFTVRSALVSCFRFCPTCGSRRGSRGCASFPAHGAADCCLHPLAFSVLLSCGGNYPIDEARVACCSSGLLGFGVIIWLLVRRESAAVYAERFLSGAGWPQRSRQWRRLSSVRPSRGVSVGLRSSAWPALPASCPDRGGCRR
jgi:hypothetical protein